MKISIIKGNEKIPFWSQVTKPELNLVLRIIAMIVRNYFCGRAVQFLWWGSLNPESSGFSKSFKPREVEHPHPVTPLSESR